MQATSVLETPRAQNQACSPLREQRSWTSTATRTTKRKGCTNGPSEFPLPRLNMSGGEKDLLGEGICNGPGAKAERNLQLCQKQRNKQHRLRQVSQVLHRIEELVQEGQDQLRLRRLTTWEVRRSHFTAALDLRQVAISVLSQPNSTAMGSKQGTLACEWELQPPIPSESLCWPQAVSPYIPINPQVNQQAASRRLWTLGGKAVFSSRGSLGKRPGSKRQAKKILWNWRWCKRAT